MIFFRQTKLIEQKGITLVLSLIILASLLGLVIVASDVSFNALRSSALLGLSETALFAAESLAEITIYDIEANDRGLDLSDITNQAATTISGATWSRQVRVATSTPSVCSAPQAKPICTNSSGAVSANNDLLVTLQNGESFQMDLDITGAIYPNTHLRVNWPGSGSSILVTSNSDQLEYTVSNVRIPPSNQFNPADGYRFRILNNSGGAVTYTLDIQGSGTESMPMGLRIMTTGNYRDTERRLEIMRPAWLLY